MSKLAIVFENITHTPLNINWGGRDYRQREVMKPYSLGECVPNWKQKYSLRDGIIKTLEDIKND